MTAAATAALLVGHMFVRRLIYTFSNGARFTATKRPKRTLLNAEHAVVLFSTRVRPVNYRSVLTRFPLSH
jgi:hypothetical protein